MRCEEEDSSLGVRGATEGNGEGRPDAGLSNAKDRMGPPVSAKQAERWLPKAGESRSVAEDRRAGRFL